MPSAPPNKAQVSTPNTQSPTAATKLHQLVHRGKIYSILTKSERRSVAKDLVTHCHSIERLQQQRFVCITADSAGPSSTASPDSADFLSLPAASTGSIKRKAIAIDCEMVGVAGNRSELALLCAVDCLTGQTLINSYVEPDGPVLDWRTRVSGVSPDIMAAARAEGRALPSWKAARAMLFKFVNADTVLVGHALNYDLGVLRISHTKIVDSSILTAEAVFGTGTNKKRRWGLKQLCQDLLGLTIQDRPEEGHDCLEDTLAARELVLRCLRYPHELEAWAKHAAKQIPAKRWKKSRKGARRPQNNIAPREEEEYYDSGDPEVVNWEDIAEDLGWPHPDTGYDPWSD
jgi:DNA polymerase III epsilon subunit-like protein